MQTKGQKTKDRILAEASQVFTRKGIRATSVSDLLAATGMTRGNLYFHFAGKEELALAVLNQEKQVFADFIEQTLAGSTAGEALNNFFLQVYARHRDTKYIGGCLFGNTALEASDTTPVFADLISVVFYQWIAKIETLVVAAQQEGEIRTDLAAHELATMIVATIEGGIMQARLLKSGTPLKYCLKNLSILLGLKYNPSKEMN